MPTRHAAVPPYATVPLSGALAQCVALALFAGLAACTPATADLDETAPIDDSGGATADPPDTDLGDTALDDTAAEDTGLDDTADDQPSREALLEAVRGLPAMPQSLPDLVPLTDGRPTLASGAPFNDLTFTLFDTTYMDGEFSGFDVFFPVDPTAPVPGADRIQYVRPVQTADFDGRYGAARGDRIVLGTAAEGPFFLRGPDGIDDDYAVIQHLDYSHGTLELAGTAADYVLLEATEADGVATAGTYLFHVADGPPDLIAFVFPCDAMAPTVSGNPPRPSELLCNPSRRLDLEDPAQFRWATPVDPTPMSSASGVGQVGTAGKEIVGGVAVDGAGNRYVYGATDGAFDEGPEGGHRVFVASYGPTGAPRWSYELDLPDGSMLKDAVADGTHLYVAGRTLGALDGFTNQGSWDAILLKLRLSDGALVDAHQHGTRGIDGWGSLALDDGDHLYAAAQGAPTDGGSGAGGTDTVYLVARYARSDLSVRWLALDAPGDEAVLASAEAWGGLTWVPATEDHPARLVTGGWFFTAGGADAFVAVYDDLDADAPTRAAYTTLRSPGQRAEWVMDNAVAPDGTIYLAGYTTGALPDGGGAVGEGDAWIMALDPDLAIEGTVQFGTPRSDLARSVHVDDDGTIVVAGTTYGDLFGTNAAAGPPSGDVFIARYRADLEPLDGVQLGTPHEDRAKLVRDGAGWLLGGTTEGVVTGASAGSFDGWWAALDDAFAVVDE